MRPVALVTGGNRGIGLGITKRLIADGYAVSILATREEPLEVTTELRELAGDDSAIRYVQGSVAEQADHVRYVEDAVAAWGAHRGAPPPYCGHAARTHQGQQPEPLAPSDASICIAPYAHQ